MEGLLEHEVGRHGSLLTVKREISASDGGHAQRAVISGGVEREKWVRERLFIFLPDDGGDQNRKAAPLRPS